MSIETETIMLPPNPKRARMLKAIYGHEFQSVVMDYVLELELQLATLYEAACEGTRQAIREGFEKE